MNMVRLFYSFLLVMTMAPDLYSSPPVFPPVKASNLNGETVSLPEGLAGRLNLVLIAFERQQQADIDTWLRVMPELVTGHPDVQYYELPVIQRPPGLVRFFIDTGMRGGIPDKAQRARTITLYLNKADFKKSLDISAETIYAVLIDKSGTILWREDGPYTGAKGDSLKHFLSGTVAAATPESRR